MQSKNQLLEYIVNHLQQKQQKSKGKSFKRETEITSNETIQRVTEK